MVDFLRLIVVAFLFSITSAQAVVPNVFEYSVSYANHGTLVGWFGSRSAACSASAAYMSNLIPQYSGTDVIQGGINKCNIVRTDSGSTSYFFNYGERGTSCPANARDAPSGPGCVCNSPYVEDATNTMCELPACPSGTERVGLQCLPVCPVDQMRVNGVCEVPDCPAGTMLIDGECKAPECKTPFGQVVDSSTGQKTAPNYGGGLMCIKKCISWPTMSGQGTQEGTGESKWFANGPWYSTGNVCTGNGTGGGGPPDSPPVSPPDPSPTPPDPKNPPPDEPPPPNNPPFSCDAGRCPGTVNGVNVCVPCGGGNSNGPTTQPTTGGPAGGGPGAPVGPNGPGKGGAGPGSGGASQSSSKCVGDKCTTTKTTWDDDGNATQTVEEKPKENFCTENPKSPLCKEGSFGGDCAAGFVCDGDAIQCAIAKETHKRWCSLVDDRSSVEAALYDSEKDKTGKLTDTEIEGSETINIGPGSFDTTNILGAASCIADKSFTIAGKSVILPFSVICPYLAMFGNMLMAIGFLLAIRIVTRG